MSSNREIGNDLPVKIIDDYVSSIINPTALASKMYVIPLSCWEIFETRSAARTPLGAVDAVGKSVT